MTARERRTAIVRHQERRVALKSPIAEAKRRYEAELSKPHTAVGPLAARYDDAAVQSAKRAWADLVSQDESEMTAIAVLRRGLPSREEIERAHAEAETLLAKLEEADVRLSHAFMTLKTVIDQAESSARALAAAHTAPREIRSRLSALIETCDLSVLVPLAPKAQPQEVRVAQLVAELLRQVIGAGAIGPTLEAQLKKARGTDVPAVA
jgi:hypothetical protein